MEIYAGDTKSADLMLIEKLSKKTCYLNGRITPPSPIAPLQFEENERDVAAFLCLNPMSSGFRELLDISCVMSSQRLGGGFAQL